MKHSIEQQPDRIDITFYNIEDSATILTEQFKKCTEGRCKCPSDELENVNELQIQKENSNIIFKLFPSDPDQVIIENLEECVQYIIAQAQKNIGFSK